MAKHIVRIPKLKQLEEKLSEDLSFDDQSIALDRLVGHYIYTDLNKAKVHLQQMERLVAQVQEEEFRLNYHWYAGQLYNQLYQFQGSAVHFQEAVKITERIGDLNQLSEIIVDSIGTWINQGKFEKARTSIEKAEQQLEQFPNPGIHARLLVRNAYLQLHVGKVPEALAIFHEAENAMSQLPQNLKLKDYYFLTLLHAGVGNIHQRAGDAKTSLKSTLKVVDLCETLGMKSRLSWHYLNVGNDYLAMDNLDDAAVFFTKAIQIKDDLSLKARAGAYANLGYVAFSRENDEQAMELFQEAEKLYHANADNDFRNFSVIKNWKARLYTRQGNIEKALQEFKEAFDLAEQGEDYKQQAEVCLEVAKFYAELEDFEQAYKYQLLHSQMDQQSRSEQQQRLILELEVKYEAEAKKKEAELLRIESSRLALKALRAQMNPHFLHNCLNAIQRFITSNDTDTAARYLAKFSRLMRQSLEYSDKELISLEDEIQFLRDYLDIFQKLRFEQFTFVVEVDDELEDDILGVPTMIIQPYVENALEHGIRSRASGEVKVIFEYRNEEEILCIVEDNGIGRAAAAVTKAKNPTTNHRSMGTMITEQRLEILQRTQGRKIFAKTTDLHDNQGNALGTRVEIVLPIQTL